jgi:hypothetical protein
MFTKAGRREVHSTCEDFYLFSGNTNVHYILQNISTYPGPVSTVSGCVINGVTSELKKGIQTLHDGLISDKLF